LIFGYPGGIFFKGYIRYILKFLNQIKLWSKLFTKCIHICMEWFWINYLAKNESVHSSLRIQYTLLPYN